MRTGGARGDVNHIVDMCEKHGMEKCGDVREGTRTRTFTLSFAITDRRKADPFIESCPDAPWYKEDEDDPKKIARLRFSYKRMPDDEMGREYENSVKDVERALGYEGPTYKMEERFPSQGG